MFWLYKVMAEMSRPMINKIGEEIAKVSDMHACNVYNRLEAKTFPVIMT